MLEPFKCFNKKILDYYFIVYRSALVGVWDSVYMQLISS